MGTVEKLYIHEKRTMLKYFFSKNNFLSSQAMQRHELSSLNQVKYSKYSKFLLDTFSIGTVLFFYAKYSRFRCHKPSEIWEKCINQRWFSKIGINWTELMGIKNNLAITLNSWKKSVNLNNLLLPQSTYFIQKVAVRPVLFFVRCNLFHSIIAVFCKM